MRIAVLSALACLAAVFAGAPSDASLSAQEGTMVTTGISDADPSGEVVICPAEYQGALKNPLMGFRPDIQNARGHEWATVARHYIKWNELENSAGDGVDKIVAFCDQHWEGLAERNIKVIPRVYLEWPHGGDRGSDRYWPADMQQGDYSSDQFKQCLVGLVRKLGQAWDEDPRVAYIESGLIGYWGEQHSPEPTPEIERLMGDAFTTSFKHKLVMVRYPMHFRGYQFGVYWDSWGTRVDTPLMLELLLTGPYAGRWKVAPMGGEVSFNYGGPPGDNPNDSLLSHLRWLDDLVHRLHWNHLGWIASYDPSMPEVRENAERLQKAFGYRFVIDEVRYRAQVAPGGSLQISFCVRNTGSSPLYSNWPVEVSLLNPVTKQPVWKGTFRGLDIRQWLPGDLWVWHLKSYDIAPEVRTVCGDFALPPDLPKGGYLLALAILDPAGSLPAARFAITNYTKGGRHPIGRIGIGVPVSDPAIDPASFDDPATDDSLHYLDGK